MYSEKLNLTMLCDFYELTMSGGYFEKGYKDRICYFDVFFRKCPDGGGFAIAAGLEQIIDYIQELHFSEEDIQYLRDRYTTNDRYNNTAVTMRELGPDRYEMYEKVSVFPDYPTIAVSKHFEMQSTPISGFIAAGYNDIKSVQYFGEKQRKYRSWRNSSGFGLHQYCGL